jgi:hypothetical protein
VPNKYVPAKRAEPKMGKPLLSRKLAHGWIIFKKIDIIAKSCKLDAFLVGYFYG